MRRATLLLVLAGVLLAAGGALAQYGNTTGGNGTSGTSVPPGETGIPVVPVVLILAVIGIVAVLVLAMAPPPKEPPL